LRFLIAEVRDNDFSVEVADSPKRGMAILRASQFDLVILDRMMPLLEKDARGEPLHPVEAGASVLADLRTIPQCVSMPVLILTNYAPADDEASEFDQFGPVSVLLKGGPFDEIMKRIRHMCGGTAANEEGPRAVVTLRDRPDTALAFVKRRAADGNWTDCQVYFEPCLATDPDVLVGLDRLRWRFPDVWRQVLRATDSGYLVSKLVPMDDIGVPLLGLYYVGGFAGDPRWASNVLFETRPDFRFDIQGRRVAGCGRVMVARFVRDWLERENPSDEELEGDFRSPEIGGLMVRADDVEKRFLLHLGFRESVGRPGFIYLPYRSALEVIRRVANA
jgi:CheY-like chemotaxis protein